MKNEFMVDFWNDIKDPKVDLKLLNDFIRNGIGLGLTWAIGINLFFNAPKPIWKYSACVILISTMILFILNIFQFMFAIVKTIKSAENFNGKKFIKWIIIITGTIIGSFAYISITIIFAENSQLVLQKLTLSASAPSNQTNICESNL